MFKRKAVQFLLVLFLSVFFLSCGGKNPLRKARTGWFYAKEIPGQQDYDISKISTYEELLSYLK